MTPGAGSRSLPTRLAVAVLLAGAALATFFLFRGLRHDDAYITFQYARRLASGDGMVFNPGERILGATSPLHTLLLASIFALFGDVLAPAANLVGACAVIAQAWLLFALVGPRRRGLAIVLALLVGAGFADSHAFLALETNLLAALVLATLWSLERDRPLLCGLFLGLAFLCRYDAALLVPVVAGIAWVRTGRFPRRILLVSLAVVVPWLAWATHYFGSCLPNTFFAERHITPAVPYLKHYLHDFAAGPWEALGAPHALWPVSPVLWVVGMLYAWRKVRPLLGLMAFGVLLLPAYAWIGPSMHPWHLYPTFLALEVAFVLGLAALAEQGARALGARRARFARALPAVVASAMILASAASTIGFARSLDTALWYGSRYRDYATIAEWMGEHVRPGQAFLSAEVGTLGYLTDQRMIDACGLINLTNDYPKRHGTPQLIELIRDYRPDIVLASSFQQGMEIQRATGYLVIKVFAWRTPWSTLLVKTPDVLRRREECERLRSALPDATLAGAFPGG